MVAMGPRRPRRGPRRRAGAEQLATECASHLAQPRRRRAGRERAVERRPVIAVPTSVGYGTNLGGLTALFGMLTGCSSGMTVVNIDNGFGAGYAASQINALASEAPA